MKKCKYILLALIIPWLNAMADVPLLLNYQGNVTDTLGATVNGNGYFKFAIVNATGNTAYWSNDNLTLNGTAPTTYVTNAITNGSFSMKLGNTNLTNMAALSASVFDNNPVYLRVWFSFDGINFEQLLPDTQMTSAAFAMKAAVADTVNNIDSTQVQTRVAQSCTGDDTISSINEDGTVICQTDDGTNYTAGTGITINGNTISATETDPTVIESVKDGVSWSEVTGIPADIADGDDTGVGNESDPTVLSSVKDGVSWSEVTAIPADIADGDQGITVEADPTVLSSVKDGVSWSEVTAIPADIADGDQGITVESDPQVGSLTNGRWCTTNGSTVNCLSTLPSETDPQVGTLINNNLCTSNGSQVNCNSSTISPTQISNNSIEANHIADEPGVRTLGRSCLYPAPIGTCSTTVTIAPVNIRAVTISTPGPGYVFVTFSARYNINHTNGIRDYLSIEINETSAPNVCIGTLNSNCNNSYRWVDTDDALPTGGYAGAIQTQTQFSVSTNAAFTYYLDAKSTKNTGITIGEYSMSVMYFPTTY